MKSTVTRRETLQLTAALGGAMSLGLAEQSTAATPAAMRRLQLEDPLARSRLYAKLRGSTIAETVYTFCRMHMYLWLGDGNLQPMLTLQNLNATQWRPLPDGTFAGVMHEVGVYTEFDTDQLVDTWKNPVTGETREVWQFSGGPQPLQMGPDGLVTHSNAALQPKEMRIDVLGDLLLSPTYSRRAFPNPLPPAQWPKEYGGETFFWDSHYLFSASVAQLLDPKVTNATATVDFQNMVSFHPWLGMGKTPGRTFGRGLGAKLRSLSDLPDGARSALEKRTPEIFDLPNWKEPKRDFVDFMRLRKPT